MKRHYAHALGFVLLVGCSGAAILGTHTSVDRRNATCYRAASVDAGRFGDAASDRGRPSWLVVERRVRKTPSGGSYHRAMVVQDTLQRPMVWIPRGADSAQLWWHDGFSGAVLEVGNDPAGLRGTGSYTTDQLVEVGPNHYAPPEDIWLVAATPVDCGEVLAGSA